MSKEHIQHFARITKMRSDLRKTRTHRKRSGIAQLSAVLWVWPPVVRRYCREVWLSSVPYFTTPVYDTDELIAKYEALQP